MPDETAIAALEALLHGNEQAVTYRHLSAHLQIPTRQAQSLLLSYITTHSSSDFCVLWCVTTLKKCGTKRISLTTTPSADALSKTVWAIGPVSFLKSTSPTAAWLATDSARELEQQAAPVSESNALRDGRYNAIRSSTSVWKPSEHAAIAVPVARNKPLGASLLASVKAKAKKKNAAKKASPFKPVGEGKNKGGGNLFASKRLGADAASKIQAEDKKKEEEKKKAKKSSAKKSRKVVQESDEEKDEDEEDQRMREMEREEMEREREEREREEMEREEMKGEEEMNGEQENGKEEVAVEKEMNPEEIERLRQEEAKRELEDLNRKEEDEPKSTEEPDSPTLKELEEPEKEKSPKRTPEKRKLNEAFGLPSDSRSGKRRIRRQVEETIENGGYIITRMVTKIFDENGNEVEEEVEPPKTKDASQSDAKPQSPDSQGTFKPLKSANGANVKNGKLKNGSAKKEKKDVKRPSSKLGVNGGTKKTPGKKAKGKNIMSYFKKT